MPRGVPASEEEIESLRRIAWENPDKSLTEWAELNAEKGHPLRDKSVVKRHAGDIKEEQMKERTGRGNTERGVVGLRVTEELAEKYPSEAEEIEKIGLSTIKKEAMIREREVEQELFEKSGERERMEQQLAEKDRQIAGLLQRLRDTQTTIRSLKPYPQRYESEKAKAEFVHDLLNTCASEYYRERGDKRKAEHILRNDEYEGADDWKRFFAGIGRRAGKRDLYLGMVLCLVAGKSVKLSKRDDGTKVFKFGVPTLESETFNWSRYRNVTITLNPNGKVLIEKGNIVSDEGCLRLTALNQKQVETIRRNPYELLVEERTEKEHLIKELGMNNKFFADLMKALSELGICAGDTLDVEEIGSGIREVKTNLEHACLVINDLLWEKYKVSEEYRLGLPKVFSDKRIIEDKVLGMNFVVYPNRTLKGVGEEEAEILRAKIETEKLRAEKKLAEAEKRIEKGKSAEGNREEAKAKPKREKEALRRKPAKKRLKSGAIKQIEKQIEEKMGTREIHKWLLNQKELSKELSFDDYCDKAIKMIIKYITDTELTVPAKGVMVDFTRGRA